VTEQPPTPEDAPAPSSEGEAGATHAGGEPAPLAEETPTVAPSPPAEESPTVVQPPPAEPPAAESLAAGPPAAVEPPAPPPVAPPPSFATDSGPAAEPRDRPEIPIAGAFAAGLVLALILKRLAR
jgi:hypothetical protein